MFYHGIKWENVCREYPLLTPRRAIRSKRQEQLLDRLHLLQQFGLEPIHLLEADETYPPERCIQECLAFGDTVFAFARLSLPMWQLSRHEIGVEVLDLRTCVSIFLQSFTDPLASAKNRHYDMARTEIIARERKITQMKDQDFLDPFLESASSVIQQVCNVGISRGEMAEKEWVYPENHTWIRIGMTGQLRGTVFFGLHDELALRIVSAMMGGFPVHEMDELVKSAISELSNMISGNASTILSSRGVIIDITPPKLLMQNDLRGITGTALSAPLDLHDMGRMEIQMVVIG